ncbi:MAG: winged helix-turn-helix domain-containing protein, partial [Candidatus Acidiferrales bacterium]
MSSRLRFGVFELDTSSGELNREGLPVKLQPQPSKVLALLARRPGRLVTREEIQQEIWGADTFVDFEKGLNFCIKQIRVALADDAETPRYIETVHSRGYRFIAPVEEVGQVAPGDAAPAESAAVSSAQVQGLIRKRGWL